MLGPPTISKRELMSQAVRCLRVNAVDADFHAIIRRLTVASAGENCVRGRTRVVIIARAFCGEEAL